MLHFVEKAFNFLIYVLIFHGMKPWHEKSKVLLFLANKIKGFDVLYTYFFISITFLEIWCDAGHL